MGKNGKKGGWREMDANVHASQTRFYTQHGGWEPTHLEMPFKELIASGGADAETKEKLKAIHDRWQELKVEANALDDDPDAPSGRRHEARKILVDYFSRHEHDLEDYARLTENDAPGEYEIKQRMIGVTVFYDYLLGKVKVADEKWSSGTPMDLFRQLSAIGRGLQRPPFHMMTMHEIAMMEGQSPAAHSWRCKVLSGEIKLAGMKGSRLTGQKSEVATESYKQCRKGNTNRRGGKKLAVPAGRTSNAQLPTSNVQGPARRQTSFLRKLHVPAKPPKTDAP